MLDSICVWYEAWILGTLHWYTSHLVILATSLTASAVLSIACAVIGIYYAVKWVNLTPD